MARMKHRESIRREAAALRVSASRLDALADMLDGVVEPVTAARDLVHRPGEFFTWDELSVTGTGIANTPTPSAAAALGDLCRVILDPLRRHIGKPIRITSAYRSPAVNAKVGSTSKSQHPKGQAADVMVVGMTSEQLAAEVVALRLPLDQGIVYAEKPHLHLSFKPNPRGQWLRHDGAGYTPWSPS